MTCRSWCTSLCPGAPCPKARSAHMVRYPCESTREDCIYTPRQRMLHDVQIMAPGHDSGAPRSYNLVPLSSRQPGLFFLAADSSDRQWSNGSDDNPSSGTHNGPGVGRGKGKPASTVYTRASQYFRRLLLRSLHSVFNSSTQ